MSYRFEERRSDSPFVERIWIAQTEHASSFTSISTGLWSMVISKWRGHITISLHGPETSATCKEFPIDGEWVGIVFKLGTFMRHFSPNALIDGTVVLPSITERSFSLCHSAWQFPDFENADTFVDRLAREDLIVYDPIVRAIDRGETQASSLRTVQYRFLRATGLSQRTLRQIERARYATALLKRGKSILDTVYEAGYSDQPHLTRSLKHYIGHTPAEIPATPIIALHNSA